MWEEATTSPIKIIPLQPLSPHIKPKEGNLTPITPKLKIACELLECALRLYYEGCSDFAALHLAGAAEELLGRFVERIGGESEFASLQRGAMRISKCLNEDGKESKSKNIAALINHAKNASKHMDQNDIDHVVFDPRAETRKILDRAVPNFYNAMTEFELDETELIRRFHLNHGT